MRSCGFCKYLNEGVCEKGYEIKKYEKLDGYARPKQCTKKQDSAKKKKESKDSYLNKKLDSLWGKAVKMQGYCSYCGKRPPEVVLHPHHIYSRRHFSTRWDIENGCCLCSGCHLFFAHKDVQEFADWLRNRKGAEELEKLRAKAFGVALFSKEDKKRMIDELENLINRREHGSI